MTNLRQYGAPWNGWLIGITLVCLALPIGIGLFALPAMLPWWVLGLIGLIYFGCALFVVRGYVILDNAILIRRLLWYTPLALHGLLSVEADPQATRRSLRLFGNGGLFVFCGWYRNRKLGLYRMFVTDPARAVVLRYPTRTVVVSPDAPEAFVGQINNILAAAR